MRDARAPGRLPRARVRERDAGAVYHPWGDVVTIVGFLDDLRDGWGSERLLVEDMLARAVAELGG